MLDADVMELLIHALVAGFYILGRINPNEPLAPPISQARVLTLLSLKVAMELLTDLATSALAFRYLADRGEVHEAEARKIWDRERLCSLLCMCVFAAMWSTDAQTFYAMMLCPAPSLGAGAPKLLSLGLCPS